MLHAKFQDHRTSGSREEDFKSFYHIWAWWSSWSCDLDHLYKLVVCACPYSSNIGLSAMTLYYPVQDKTTTRLVYTQNYYTKNNKQKNIIYLSKTKESI